MRRMRVCVCVCGYCVNAAADTSVRLMDTPSLDMAIIMATQEHRGHTSSQ